jgi:hypothetical protein
LSEKKISYLLLIIIDDRIVGHDGRADRNVSEIRRRFVDHRTRGPSRYRRCRGRCRGSRSVRFGGSAGGLANLTELFDELKLEEIKKD